MSPEQPVYYINVIFYGFLHIINFYIFVRLVTEMWFSRAENNYRCSQRFKHWSISCVSDRIGFININHRAELSYEICPPPAEYSAVRFLLTLNPEP